MKKMENAFTGLEAAIVLIAFVVVAAVFSYVMLGAGFFTAQEAQSVVHTGMGQAASSIEVLGDVYGFATTANEPINRIVFTIGLTAGNEPMDISNMRVTYADRDQRSTVTSVIPSAGTDPENDPTNANEWGITKVFDAVDDPKEDAVLYPTEKFQIEVRPQTAIGPNTRFTVSMQPEVGALTTVVRTTPGSIHKVQVLR